MENPTTTISSNEKGVEVSCSSNKDISDNLDIITFFLLEAIKRKSNEQLQRKGA